MQCRQMIRSWRNKNHVLIIFMIDFLPCLKVVHPPHIDVFTCWVFHSPEISSLWSATGVTTLNMSTSSVKSSLSSSGPDFRPVHCDIVRRTLVSTFLEGSSLPLNAPLHNLDLDFSISCEEFYCKEKKSVDYRKSREDLMFQLDLWYYC